MLAKAIWLRIGQFLVVFSLLAAWMLSVITSYGQALEWSQPVPLSQPGRKSWFPDVAADATGRVHVVWASDVTGYDTVMYTTSQDGLNWSAVNDIMALPQAAGSEATRPTLLIDRHDLMHMTFRDTRVLYSQAPVASAYLAGAWLSPHTMSASQVAYFSRVVQDSHDTLHLVFTENVLSSTCPICYHVFYRRSEDHGLNWSPAIDISGFATGSAKPQLVVDGQDNLHLVWEAGRGGSYGQLVDPTKVMYAASYDRGHTWRPPSDLNAPDTVAKDIAIGLDGDSNLLAVWLSLPEDKVYYRVSNDQGRFWSSPQAVPGVWGGRTIYDARLDDYSMATDSAGDVHLALVGRVAEDQSSLSVLHVVWDGSAWSGPDAITTLVGDAPEWPRLAIGNGNQLSVVWFVRDEAHIFDPDNGQQYQVWYARGLSSAPAVTAVALPLLTPTSETQVAPASPLPPTPAPTPTPSRPRFLTPVPSGSTSTETDELLLLVESLLPVILLIAVVAIGVRFRRR